MKKQKRIGRLAMATVMALKSMVVTIPAGAEEDVKVLGNFEYKITNSSVEITKYLGSDSYVYIPDEIDGRKVTRIAMNSFGEFGKSSDESFSYLEKVRLPAYLEFLDGFSNCVKLQSIVIPNSVKFVSSGCFYGCSELSEVIMGNNLENISWDYYHNKYDVENIYPFFGTSISQISLSEKFEKDLRLGGLYSLPLNKLFLNDPYLSDIYIRGKEFNYYMYSYDDRFTYPDPVVHYTNITEYNTRIDYNKEYHPIYEIKTDYVPLEESHCKVTFDTNGGDTANSEIWTLNGQMVSEEVPPVKKDCEFIGWYTNREGNGEKWDFTTDRVYSNMTLYAKFRPAQYRVTFNSEGGICDTTSKDYSFGLAMGTLPVPTKANYTFIGWYTRPDANGDLYTSSTIMPRSSITLYAGWLQQGKSLVVNYDPNGGKCSISKSLAEYDKCITDLPVPTKEGNKFIGWNTSPDGKGDFYTSATRIKQPYITLYAIWKADTFTVSLKPNGGTISSQSKMVEYGARIGTLPTPSRSGYEFSGWYYSDGSRFNSSDIMPSKSVSLTAKWTGFEYMILLDPRGGYVSDDAKYVSCGENIGFLAPPTRKGYKFMGWYTKPNRKGYQYTSNTEMPEKDITLYAGWKKVTDYASKVQLDKRKLTMGVGQKYISVITTVPAETIDKFTWTSSDKNVASVDSKGVITALKKGTATITVTTSKGKTASIRITVKKAVSSIKVPYTSRKVSVGQTIKITPTANGYAGVLTWSSSNSAIASVDSKGNVTAIRKGTVVITVKAYNGISTKVTLTVK